MSDDEFYEACDVVSADADIDEALDSAAAKFLRDWTESDEKVRWVVWPGCRVPEKSV